MLLQNFMILRCSQKNEDPFAYRCLQMIEDPFLYLHVVDVYVEQLDGITSLQDR